MMNPKALAAQGFLPFFLTEMAPSWLNPIVTPNVSFWIYDMDAVLHNRVTLGDRILISFVIAGFDAATGLVSLAVEASANYPGDFIHLPTQVMTEAMVAVTPGAGSLYAPGHPYLGSSQRPSTNTMIDTG